MDWHLQAASQKSVFCDMSNYSHHFVLAFSSSPFITCSSSRRSFCFVRLPDNFLVATATTVCNLQKCHEPRTATGRCNASKKVFTDLAHCPLVKPEAITVTQNVGRQRPIMRRNKGFCRNFSGSATHSTSRGFCLL